MGDEAKKKPKTIATMIAAALPALITGYLNHLKDEGSRAALVNESIRLEQKIDACEAKADRNAGFLSAAVFFARPTPVESLTESESKDPRTLIEQSIGYSRDAPEGATTSTRSSEHPKPHARSRKGRDFKDRYKQLF